METTQGIASIEQAAVKLEGALHTKIEGDIQKINAISERMGLFGEDCSAFADRLVEFLRNLVKTQVLDLN